MGDLSFSANKRLCGVKDYGSLIPGPRRMLDRFDSLLLTGAGDRGPGALGAGLL
jgi:phosphatidate cytidylyltransferase